MTAAPDVSLVVETFNLGEGQGLAALRAALRAASEIAAPRGWEVLLAATLGDAGVTAGLEREFPALRVVAAVGLGYDHAKMRAAAAARGQYVVFLDGDCVPDAADWADRLVAPLRGGAAVGTTGTTVYDSTGLLARACTVLDFGYLYDAEDGGALGCYASNNAAFARAALLAAPIGAADMRCACYAHAQALWRRGTPVRRVAAARARHKPPPFWRERIRRGYEHIAATWVDPDLPEARDSRRGLARLAFFYALNVRQDWRRTRRARQDLNLSPAAVAAVLALCPLLRLVDLVGLARAMREERARARAAPA